jgi:hypothetical protein
MVFGNEDDGHLIKVVRHETTALVHEMQPSQPVVARSTASTRPLMLMFCGGIAGATAKSVVAPLERVKLLLQTGEGRGVVATLAAVVRREGVAGLWKGNLVNVIRMVPNKVRPRRAAETVATRPRPPPPLSLVAPYFRASRRCDRDPCYRRRWL